jgi:hypothetical protein
VVEVLELSALENVRSGKILSLLDVFPNSMWKSPRSTGGSICRMLKA